MKNLFLLIILITNVLFVKAQEDSTSKWFNKYQDFRYQNKKGENYVYLLISKGGIKKILYQYIQIDTSIVVRLFDSSENIKVILLKKDILFDYLDSNWKSIKLFKNRNNEPNFRKNFEDTNYLMKQVGIKYNDIHFNHFIPKSSNEISKIKNHKIKEATLIINAIEGYFINLFNK